MSKSAGFGLVNNKWKAMKCNEITINDPGHFSHLVSDASLQLQIASSYKLFIKLTPPI